MNKVSKEKIATALTFIVLIGAFALGIFFLVRLVNGPGSGGKSFDILSGEKKTYTHPDYGFTFDYPASFTIGNFGEGDGETVLVQAADGKSGFQIFVSLYEEEKPLSKAIIEESVPELKISGDRETEVGEEKIKALSFDSSGTGSGDTREIWFVQDGNLYQFTSYKDFGGEMENILGTLRFN